VRVGGDEIVFGGEIGDNAGYPFGMISRWESGNAKAMRAGGRSWPSAP